MNVDEKYSINMIEGPNEIDSQDPPEKIGLKEDLIIEPKKHSENKKGSSFANCCRNLFPCFKRVDTTSSRTVYFNNQYLNVTN